MLRYYGNDITSLTERENSSQSTPFKLRSGRNCADGFRYSILRSALANHSAGDRGPARPSVVRTFALAVRLIPGCPELSFEAPTRAWHQFLEARFLISEHRGRLRGPRQRKTSGAERHGRLTAGPCHHGRALLFASCHMPGGNALARNRARARLERLSGSEPERRFANEEPCFEERQNQNEGRCVSLRAGVVGGRPKYSDEKWAMLFCSLRTHWSYEARLKCKNENSILRTMEEYVSPGVIDITCYWGNDPKPGTTHYHQKGNDKCTGSASDPVKRLAIGNLSLFDDCHFDLERFPDT